MVEISVVLSVYNMEECLAPCIDSLLHQTFQNFEVICVDDGSTDTTPCILAGYARQDDRFKIIRQENAGPGAARNAGLDCATGRYVMLLDSDDIFDVRLLESLLTESKRTDADVVICRSQEYDHITGALNDAWWSINISQVPEQTPFSWHDMCDFPFTAFIGWPWDKLYRRDFIERHHLRFPQLDNSEDLYFVFLSLIKAERMSIVDEALIRHRINRGSSVSNSRTRAPLQFYESICLLKRELQKNPAQYEKLSWGFLNWALTYLVWNTDSLPDGPARDAILAAIRADGLPELELSLHTASFFSLDPKAYARYLELLDEPTMQSNRRRHPLLRYVIAFLEQAESQGLAAACRQFGNWVRRKTSSEAVDKTRTLKRGASLPKQAARRMTTTDE